MVVSTYGVIAERFESLRLFDDSLAFHSRAIEVAREHAHIALEAQATRALAFVYQKAGQTDVYVMKLEDFLKLALASQSEELVATARADLLAAYATYAEQHMQANNVPAAIALYRKGAEVARAAQDLRAEGQARFRLGQALDLLPPSLSSAPASIDGGDEAVRHLSEYLDIATQLGDATAQAAACEALATAYTRRTQLEPAARYLHQYRELTERTGDQAGLAKACASLGTVLNQMVRAREQPRWHADD